MYDLRVNKKIFSVNHSSPIESIVFLPSGGIFLSAGKSYFLYYWPILKVI